ncbi:MAG: hypothetical protein EA374_08005 [Acholeplasmatales bacterium]|nr:MAG: hypothetical protein EA374_08005 [Acholeplasmatales bacterium]
MKRWVRWLIRLSVLMLVVGLIGLVALNRLTYRADVEAVAVLDMPEVHVSRNLIRLEPETHLGNVIIYQGGLVETEAYLVFASVLRDKGYRVFLPKMPFNLAILRRDAFSSIQAAYPSALPWIAVGHSLGGATLSFIAADDRMDALVLLGAYPAESVDLTHLTIPVFSIFGERDTVLNQSTLEATKPLLPTHTEFIEIPGGNHAWFGHYGEQKGDGQATLSRAEQQQIVINRIISQFE